MRTIKIKVEGMDLDFEKARKIADAVAEGMLIAWSDGERSYPEVCCVCNDMPGWMAYGETRGDLKIEINEKFIFYYKL